MNRAPLDSDRSTSWRLAMARTCFGAFVAALLCVACHDWLTVPPLNDPTPGDVGKNPLTIVSIADARKMARDWRL